MVRSNQGFSMVLMHNWRGCWCRFMHKNVCGSRRDAREKGESAAQLQLAGAIGGLKLRPKRPLVRWSGTGGVRAAFE